MQRGSRGRGARRGPWRDGGARKARTPSWTKQAAHAVPNLDAIEPPRVTLPYFGLHEQDLSKRVYKLDQALHSCGIDYHAVWTSAAPIDIVVRLRDADQTRKCIAELERRARPESL